MAKGKKVGRGASRGEARSRAHLLPIVLWGASFCALAVWACRISWYLLRPEDLVPVLLAVVAAMAGLPALFAFEGKGVGRRLSVRRALVAQTLGALFLVLAMAYGLRVLLPERVDAKRVMAETVKRALSGDPLAVEIQKAFRRAATGTASEAWESPELDEAIDSARHFVHGWLSNDRAHAEAFCVESLKPALRKAELPPRRIVDPAKVPLTAVVIEDHVYDGKNMRLKVRYGDWHGDLLLERDFGWQVAALP